MKPRINLITFVRTCVILMLVVTGISAPLTALAKDLATLVLYSRSEAEPATLQVQMNDASGRAVTFAPGTQICFDVLTGGVVFQSRCLTGIYDPDLLIAGAPDPTAGAYSMVITSNTTTCTATAGTPVVNDFGAYKFVTIELLTNCPPMPEPTDYYSFIAIEYVDSTGAATTYPGQLCVDLVIPAGSTFPAPRTQCSDSTGRIWSHFAAPGLVPHGLAYRAAVVSNDTGCTVTQSFLDVTVDTDVVATIRMTITCAPPVPTSYDGVVITLRDSTGAATTYPGLMCIDFAVAPATTIPSHATPCVTTTGDMLILRGDPGVFPLTSTYTAVFGLNQTLCGSSYTVAPFTESGESFLVITVTLTCEVVVPSPTATTVPSPTATTVPSPTATAATATTTGTTVPDPTAAATAPVPTPTSVATVPTTVATTTPTAPGAVVISTTTVRTPVPPASTSKPAKSAVTSLPKTGVGVDGGIVIALMLGVFGTALVLAGALRSRLPRR